MFFEDFEREHLKDSVYLYEEKMLMEQQWWQWEEELRFPAKVKINIEENIQNHESESEILPFSKNT